MAKKKFADELDAEGIAAKRKALEPDNFIAYLR